MRWLLAVSLTVLSSGAIAQAPSLAHKSFFREDGQPTDKVLLQASRACHQHNPDPADAKENCAVVDDQIAKRNLPSK
jgi:hypothetical protein